MVYVPPVSDVRGRGQGHVGRSVWDRLLRVGLDVPDFHLCLHEQLRAVRVPGNTGGYLDISVCCGGHDIYRLHLRDVTRDEERGAVVPVHERFCVRYVFFSQPNRPCVNFWETYDL